MAKPSFFDHPKFKRLVHLLGMIEPHVYGHVEYLWRVAYAAGNATIGDSIDVELAAKWQGEKGLFARTMVEVGLLDTHPKTGKLQVHDLFDHAPDYVASRFRMEAYRRRKKRERLRNRYGSNGAEQNRTEQNGADQTGGNTGEEGAPPAAPKPKTFTPPTLKEVSDYFLHIGSYADPEKFFDHFTSNGWKVSGKAAMKDWKSAIRNWVKREKGFASGGRRDFRDEMREGVSGFMEDQQK